MSAHDLHMWDVIPMIAVYKYRYRDRERKTWHICNASMMYLHMLHQKSGSEVSCFRIRSNSRVLLSLPATVLAIQAQVSVLWIPWSDEWIRGKLQERVRMNNSASIKWAHAKKKKKKTISGREFKGRSLRKMLSLSATSDFPVSRHVCISTPPQKPKA